MASKKTNKQTSTSAIAQDINNNNIMNTTKNNQHASTTTDAPPNGPMRRSKRAGVVFPVHRIHRVLKERNTSRQIRNTAAVYMAGVLEYLVAEVTELAGNVARDHKRHRITPRHIFLAIHNDDELSKTCDNVTIAAGGVMPHIHAVLLPSKVSNSQSLKGDAPKAPKKKPNSKKQDATKVTVNTDNGDDSTMEQ